LHFHYFATFFLDSKFYLFVTWGITWFCWFDDVGIQSRSNFVQLFFFVETQNMHILVVIIHFILVIGVLVMVNDAMFCACHDVNY